MARKAEDDFTVYGICREAECHYLWLKEPTEPVSCPSCGTPGWPMSPAEAEARLRKAFRVGGECPEHRCEGKFRVCEPCTNRERDIDSAAPAQLECRKCGCHQPATRRPRALHPNDIVMTMDDGTMRRFGDSDEARRLQALDELNEDMERDSDRRMFEREDEEGREADAG